MKLDANIRDQKYTLAFIIYTHATHEKGRLDTILPIFKSLEKIHARREGSELHYFGIVQHTRTVERKALPFDYTHSTKDERQQGKGGTIFESSQSIINAHH